MVFTITATNNGPGNATGVVVADPIPAGLTYVSDDGGGAFDAGTGTWTIGILANGVSAVLKITVRVIKAGAIISTTVVSGNEFDPDAGNNALIDLVILNFVNIRGNGCFIKASAW